MEGKEKTKEVPNLKRLKRKLNAIQGPVVDSEGGRVRDVI